MQPVVLTVHVLIQIITLGVAVSTGICLLVPALNYGIVGLKPDESLDS